MASVVRKKQQVVYKWVCLMACQITAHISEVPAAVRVDRCRSLDSGVIKFLSQVTLASSMQVVSKAGNGSRSQYDGSEAGD